MIVANECGGRGPHSRLKEVRVLPIGGGANMILCRACFDHEIAYRRERNKRLSEAAQYVLPTWDSLEVFKSGEQ